MTPSIHPDVASLGAGEEKEFDGWLVRHRGWCLVGVLDDPTKCQVHLSQALLDAR
jgi:hypothetical protein